MPTKFYGKLLYIKSTKKKNNTYIIRRKEVKKIPLTVILTSILNLVHRFLAKKKKKAEYNFLPCDKADFIFFSWKGGMGGVNFSGINSKRT